MVEVKVPSHKRAAALRSVTEDADLRLAELNRAFMLMQYYVYLRRNADDPLVENLFGVAA